MPLRQPLPASRVAALPRMWLLTDPRNDAVLERAIRALPHGSGVVFRHYHLDSAARRTRFAQVRGLCRRCGHVLVLAGSPELARKWGAQGAYCAPGRHRRERMPMLASAHNLRELREAARAGASAVLLSPVFATRSHKGARPLGPVRFARLARWSRVPVIALGGMTRRRWQHLPRGAAHGWAAIDGLSVAPPRWQRQN